MFLLGNAICKLESQCDLKNYNIIIVHWMAFTSVESQSHVCRVSWVLAAIIYRFIYTYGAINYIIIAKQAVQQQRVHRGTIPT